MFAISLSPCSRYNATLNWTNHSVRYWTVRHIFEISEDDYPRLLTHAGDIWWTLDFANALVSTGVNSRGELVPSHGASRRRLGDKTFYVDGLKENNTGCAFIAFSNFFLFNEA
jgi:hypothetical protein